MKQLFLLWLLTICLFVHLYKCQIPFTSQRIEKAKSRQFLETPPEFKAYGASQSISAPMKNYFYNAQDFGAKGDQTTDNTDIINQALNSIDTNGGGVLLVPPGKYLFNGNINVPKAVTIKGSFQSVPSHDGFRSLDQYQGTVLLPTSGEGNASGTPFITLGENSVLQGVVIYYKNQPQAPTTTPTPYPWTISMPNNNAAVMDCELVNPYQAIISNGGARHFISKVDGQPIYRGIYLDNIFDIGRVENVHWNPWWSQNEKVLNFQMTQGEAFVIARSDWEYVFNTFAFGYAYGYHFIKSEQGECNGNFLGIGADLMTKASVYVEASQKPGILITNGEFTSFVDETWCPDCKDFKSTEVQIAVTNTGPVRFVNSAFWGPSYQIANLEAVSTLGFSECIFNSWDSWKVDQYAITASLGNIILIGNQFDKDGKQVNLLKGVGKAIIIGNIIKGTQRIDYDTSVKIEVSGNVAD